MPLSLPTLPPNALYNQGQFQIWWQQLTDAIEAQFDALEEQVTAIAAAQAAADAANAAAAAADAAATTANAAANTAQTAADDVTAAGSLQASYVTGAVITASDAGTDATVTISAHTRHYPQPDGSTVDVAVNGGSVTGLPYSTFEYIYYDDPTRAGGAVTYHATTSDATAAQLGDRHTVGAITTPAATDPDTGGVYTKPPGSNQFPEP